MEGGCAHLVIDWITAGDSLNTNRNLAIFICCNMSVYLFQNDILWMYLKSFVNSLKDLKKNVVHEM